MPKGGREGEGEEEGGRGGGERGGGGRGTGHGQLFDHLVGALLERHYLKLIKSVRLSVEALGFKGSFVAFALF